MTIRGPIFLTWLVSAAACGCINSASDVDAGSDSGESFYAGPDSGFDAGTDAGRPYYPPLEIICPPPPAGSGRVWGTTPLGDIDFPNVWAGTDPSSCRKIIIVASPVLDRPVMSFLLELRFLEGPVLGPKKARASLDLGPGKLATIVLDVDVSVSPRVTQVHSQGSPRSRFARRTAAGRFRES